MLKDAINIIGPVWWIIAIVAVFEVGLMLFVILSLKFLHVEDRSPEKYFLQSLNKANTALSSIAVMAGFLGTYLGLLQALPELKNVIQGNANSAAEIITGLQQAFGSSMAGLIVGGMTGSLNEFLLHLLFPTEESESVAIKNDNTKSRLWLQKLIGKKPSSNNYHHNAKREEIWEDLP